MKDKAKIRQGCGEALGAELGLCGSQESFGGASPVPHTASQTPKEERLVRQNEDMPTKG